MSQVCSRVSTLSFCLFRCAALLGVFLGVCMPVQAQERAEQKPGVKPVELTIDAANPAANVSPSAGVQRVFAETFESDVFPPAGWTRFEVGDGGGTQQWVLTNIDGNRLAYNRYSDFGTGTVEDWLVTPLLTVTSAESTLSFDMAQQYVQLWGSAFAVAVSTTSADQPSAFEVLASWNETQGPDGQPAPPIFTDGFETYTLDLSAFVGQDVYVAFVHENDYGDSFLLDNVAGPTAYTPSAPPVCASGFLPTNGSISASSETLFLSWQPPTGGETASGYRVNIGTDPGATNIANDFDIGNNTSIELENARPGVTYYYRVEPYNGAGSASDCSTVSFMTAGSQARFPFTEDFDDTASCALPANWSVDSNPVSGESWVFRSQMEYGAPQDHTSGEGCFATVNDSSPNDAPVHLFSPFFDFTSLTSPALSFWVQNRGTSRPSTYSDLYVDVTTDEGDSYVIAAGQATGRYRNWTKISVDLSGYAGEPSVRLRFRNIEASNDFRSDMSLDDVFVGENPNGAAFAISPGSAGTYSFGTVAPCAGRERIFTIVNDGTRRSTLNMSTLRLAGDASFSVVDVAPAFPVILGEDETVALRVQFNPTMKGSHEATLEVDYTLDGGAEQTYALALSGEGDALGVSAGEGAGYMWRNSTICSDMPVGPEDIAFGPTVGDTQISVWETGTANDGYTAIDLTPTIGSFRFFAEDYETVYVSTNGYVFFDFGTVTPGPPFPATTEFETAYIAALGDDLDLTTDGAVYYRGRDTDSDGSDDELVITFFRVPRFNVPSEFATFQVILQRSGTPGGNGTVKLQYLPGTSPDDGQPLSQGFNKPNSFNEDARVGITGDQGFASVLYRDNGSGGVLFGGNSLAIEFAPRDERIEGADGASAGWRMLSAPTAGMTVANLAEQNLVQGIPDEYPVDAEGNTAVPNIYTDFSSASGFQRPSGLGEVLTPGKGFIWYLYDSDYDPEVDADIPTGDSQSYPLPAPIVAVGDAHATDVTATFTSAPGGDGVAFELLGNPYSAPLNVRNIASWTTGSLASAVGQVWEPATGTYITTSDLGDKLPVWQGALFENDTATEITYPLTEAQAVRSTPTHVATPGDGDLSGAPRRVRFELSGAVAGSGVPTQDRALVLEFSDDGTDGWDIRDATKLTPLTNVYATAAFEGERNGASRLKAQESRSAAPIPFEVPIHVETSGVTDDLELGWTLDAFPADWQFTLQDQEAGKHVDLRQEPSYAFTLDGARRTTSKSEPSQDVLTRFAQPAPMERGSEARFTLVVVPGAATAGESQSSLPAQLALSGIYPNPFAGRTTVRYALPSDARVRLAIYDLLGRRIAVLADGFTSAGYHEASWDASGRPSGVYLVRLESEGQRVFQKVTLTQ